MIPSHRLSAVWLAFLLASGAILCNLLLFVRPPVQRAIPWLSAVLAVFAFSFLARGLQHLFSGKPRSYAGRRVLGSILSLVSLLFAGVAIFAFFQARTLPRSAGAPRIGQKAPDFTLIDMTGQPVSLGQLFASPGNNAQSAPTKAVLLIFYRGYW
jgi:hypothetical protein